MSQRLNALPTTRNKDLILTVMGIGLMFLCSQYSIPIQPVPITLSMLGVLLIGLTYTPKQAAYTMGGWILLGAMGFPMFAGFKSGIPALLGPTGGYIVGFFFIYRRKFKRHPAGAFTGFLPSPVFAAQETARQRAPNHEPNLLF